ncbi:hypothetical protein B0O99DRAFT_601562 [Bisporella sp. PMI_857]|nr:hypothetical protein B0O99DRAFT_601562 [Bisporella sp. PMI_857]
MPPICRSASPPAPGTDAGSAIAAQDLYGVGVRLGLYLQGIGMLLPTLRSVWGIQIVYQPISLRNRSWPIQFQLRKLHSTLRAGAGSKLACGSISISLLSSWTILAARKLLSPSEAYLVLFLMVSIIAPAKATLFDTTTVIGETIGLAALMITDLWVSAAFIWLFARLYHTLPPLYTQQVVCFFAKLSITGSFRIVMLVLCIVEAISTLALAFFVGKATKVSLECYIRGDTEISDDKRREAEVYARMWSSLRPWCQKCIRTILPLFLWSFAVAAVERTIAWNALSPTMDISSPGQLIPLVTGIIVSINGLLLLFYPNRDDREEDPEDRDTGNEEVEMQANRQIEIPLDSGRVSV